MVYQKIAYSLSGIVYRFEFVVHEIRYAVYDIRSLPPNAVLSTFNFSLLTFH